MKLTGPSVTFEVNEWRPEDVRATLTAYRTKRDGTSEEVTIVFEEIDLFELKCIGRSAVRAMREMKQRHETRCRAALEFATGWQEGEGP